jgi:hypothetical protein
MITSDLQKGIDELDSKAAESILIADPATDLEARTTNARPAQELRDYVEQLCRRRHPCGNQVHRDRGRPSCNGSKRSKLAVAIRPQQAHGRQMFDYEAAAELFFGHPGMRARSKVGYRRFASASSAVLFAVEQLSPTVFNGTFLEVNDDRFNAAEIRSLYEHIDFPLVRKAG